MKLIGYYPGIGYANSFQNRADTWKPAVDVVEEKDKFTLEIDLPGLTKEDFKLTVDQGVLTISGERKSKTSEDENLYRNLERPGGTFERSFKLPENVNAEKIEASYIDGVLKLELVKKEEAKPRTIKIA